jgi:PRTRC genetic system protein E
VALFFNLKENIMFTQLDSIITEETSLTLKLTRGANGTLKVVVMPTTSSKNPALAQPLAMAASPAELDAGFADLIGTYQANRLSLTAQVAATAAILGEATKKASDKAVKSLQSKDNTKPAANATDDDEQTDDANDDTIETSASKGNDTVPAASGSDQSDLLALLG